MLRPSPGEGGVPARDVLSRASLPLLYRSPDIEKKEPHRGLLFPYARAGATVTWRYR